MPNLRALFPPQSDEFVHLDVLRFLASLGVVAIHTKEFFVDRAARAAVSAQTQNMAMFVDLFFIISGFIIAFVYNAKVATPAQYGDYMRRRLARLMPLHWATFGVAVLLQWAILKAGMRMQHEVPFDPACMASTLALTQTYLGCQADQFFNGVNWSLSAEMGMYVIFPALLLVGRRLGRAVLPAALVGGVLLVAGASLQQGVGPNALHWNDIFPPLRALPAFFFGVALYLGRGVVARFPAARPVLWSSLALLVVLMVSGAGSALVLACTYLVVAAAVAADLQKAGGPVVTGVAPLGQLTYSMYLIHPAIVLILMNGLGDKILKLSPLGMVPVALLCYALIFAASYASLVWFETPARRYLERAGRREPAPVLQAG